MSTGRYTDSNSIDGMADNAQASAVADDLDEYATQYLGFTPRAFTNGLYNAYLDYMTDGMNAMGDFLQERFSDIVTPEDVKEGVDGVLKAAQTPMEETFDMLESYLEGNIFKIPENIVLPEDRVQLNGPYTKKDEIAIDKDIKELREKILAVKYENSELLSDLKKMETVRAKQTYVLHQFDQMKKVLADVGVTDLNDALSSACSRTKKLVEAAKGTSLIDSPPTHIDGIAVVDDLKELNGLKIHRETMM